MSVNFNFLVGEFSKPLTIFKSPNLEHIVEIADFFPAYTKFLFTTLEDLPFSLVFLVKENFIDQYGKYVILKTQNTEEFNSGFLETVMLVSGENKLELLKPGIVGIADLKKILPKVEVSANYTYGLLKTGEIKIIDETKLELFLENKDKCVLGTKEKIRQTFFGNNTKNPSSYNIKNSSTKIIAIGSQTNPKTIVQFLANRLDYIILEEQKTMYWLNQAWPKNHWGDILTYFSKSIALSSSATFQN